MSTTTVPAVRDDLRRHLPGLEPERTLTDWGRSERVEDAADRTVVEFLYRYWFRVDVEGIEHVPSAGGALLTPNHAGLLPPDAAMIARAVREEHPHGRPVHITVEHAVKALPGLSMLAPKVGAVPAHPANLHRLLYDEQQLVLLFPEGRRGAAKPFSRRYRLRRFGRGGFVRAAIRARAPIVPVCVVGSEEAMPSFLPRARPLGVVGYLPAKFTIRFLEPFTFPADASPEDSALVQTTAHDIRATIQENLFDMLGKRQSVWFG